MVNFKSEYDTKNVRRVLELLEKNIRGLTAAEIARELKLNRHTVSKILERLLIEKRVDYEEKGPSKIFFSTGKSKFVARIDLDKDNKLWIDIFYPKYSDQEKFIRINQTKHDSMAKSSSKFRSVGAVSIKISKLNELIEILKSIKQKL
ncbi:MAG: hypothetical protein B6U78_00155 [Candidatus Aenigmarchaeota archaeon ex4484_224]|nr:MAG: hypothetical protein B6U78_00155 [Candidatus Aenigmarchaeota archaeon ex4484_224]